MVTGASDAAPGVRSTYPQRGERRLNSSTSVDGPNAHALVRRGRLGAQLDLIADQDKSRAQARLPAAVARLAGHRKSAPAILRYRPIPKPVETSVDAAKQLF